MKRIDESKEKLSIYPFDILNNKKFLPAIFTSNDENLHHSIICRSIDIFNVIENRLYKEYPEYSENDNYFVVNGKIVNKEKTLEENNIKNSDIIILNRKKD